MAEPLYIRPSLWPMVIEHCPSAAEPVAYQVERPNPDRELGNANHRLFAMHNHGRVINNDDIIEASEYFGCDTFYLSALWRNTEGALQSLEPFWATASQKLVEARVPGGGTVDFAALDVDEEVAAIVVDLKKREGPNHRHQLIRYADSVRRLCREKGVDLEGRKIKGVAIYAEGGDEGTYTVWDFTAKDFELMAEKEAEVRSKIGKVYVPGDHCGRCPRMHTCGPLEEYGRSALRVMDQPVEMLSLKKAGEIYAQAEILSKRISDFRAWLRIVLIESGGTAPLGNGKEAYVQDQKISKMDVRKSWGALMEYGFTPEEMEKVAKISLSAAVNVEKGKHGRTTTGKTKKEAEAELRAYLDARDCISYTDIKKLTTRKERKKDE